jgi:hypothetical protein
MLKVKHIRRDGVALKRLELDLSKRSSRFAPSFLSYAVTKYPRVLIVLLGFK